MDSPSQVDAPPSLRAGHRYLRPVRNPSAILMVSHDIKEVAHMATAHRGSAANPRRVLRIVDNNCRDRATTARRKCCGGRSASRRSPDMRCRACPPPPAPKHLSPCPRPSSASHGSLEYPTRGAARSVPHRQRHPASLARSPWSGGGDADPSTRPSAPSCWRLWGCVSSRPRPRRAGRVAYNPVRSIPPCATSPRATMARLRPGGQQLILALPHENPHKSLTRWCDGRASATSPTTTASA